MSDAVPARRDSDGLADVVEMLLDKGVVINADIAVAVGDTELLAIQIRAALASFETAAEYGLQFPDGTDMQRVAAASGRSNVQGREATPGIEAGDQPADQQADQRPDDTSTTGAPGTAERNDDRLRPTNSDSDGDSDGGSDDDEGVHDGDAGDGDGAAPESPESSTEVHDGDD